MSKQKTIVDRDQELITGVRLGSSDSLSEIYREHFPMILKMILNNNGEEADAKDIFQESLIVLYDKAQSEDFVLKSQLKTFLYSVCRRLWLKRLNKHGFFDLDIQDVAEYIPVEDTLQQHKEKEHQFFMMEESLKLLGEPCQTIIRDFYLHEMSMQEICEKFGYTNTDNAKTQKYKCLQRLKKLFFQR